MTKCCRKQKAVAKCCGHVLFGEIKGQTNVCTCILNMSVIEISICMNEERGGLANDTLDIPLISVICIGSLLNGRRLQSISDPLRRDTSPLNVDFTSYVYGMSGSRSTLIIYICKPDVTSLGVRSSGKICLGS